MNRVTLYYASMFVFGVTFVGWGLRSGLADGFGLPVTLALVAGVGMASLTVYQATTLEDPDVGRLTVGAQVVATFLLLAGVVLSVLG
jgi:hypothetical protein